jgi:hypothetical protein
MTLRLYVGTRKGLFILEPGGSAGWRIERTSFLGDPVSMVLEDRREGALYAALKLGHFGVKLHRSDDLGQSWKECAAPAFPKEPGEGEAEKKPEEGEAGKTPSVSEIWELEAGGAGEPGLLWAGTIPGGLFRSSDGGGSWELVRSLWDLPERREWFGGGADKPGIHSVCVDPRDSRRVTIGVSCGGVWQSTDGGTSWRNRSKGMFAEYMPPERREDPNIQDPHRVRQCAAAPEAFWAQHHNGVFRSTDGAATWEAVPTVQPSVFGFGVAVHPQDPDTAWFVPAVKDQKRIPVDGKLVMARTRDGGKSFEVLRNGLPQEHAYDLVFRHALDVDGTGERLAFGSTTGGLWTTEDGGDAWRCVSAHLPPIYCVRFAG